jgi:Ca2+-binding EF-hand superfamily protein
MTIKKLKDGFRKFDSDKKGFLTNSELEKLFEYYKIEASDEEKYTAMSEYDKNLNGNINYLYIIRYLIETQL